MSRISPANYSGWSNALFHFLQSRDTSQPSISSCTEWKLQNSNDRPAFTRNRTRGENSYNAERERRKSRDEGPQWRWGRQPPTYRFHNLRRSINYFHETLTLKFSPPFLPEAFPMPRGTEFLRQFEMTSRTVCTFLALIIDRYAARNEKSLTAFSWHDDYLSPTQIFQSSNGIRCHSDLHSTTRSW